VLALALAALDNNKFNKQVTVEELNHILRQVDAHILLSPSIDSHFRSMAGGSVANTIRGLSAGFRLSTAIIGACGDDPQGRIFMHNMSLSGVDLSRLRIHNGPTAQVLSCFFHFIHLSLFFSSLTSYNYTNYNYNYNYNSSFSVLNLAYLQCACLVDASGNRTMRPCLSNAVKLQVLTTNFFLIYLLGQFSTQVTVSIHFPSFISGK
jgi:hypothetical protein